MIAISAVIATAVWQGVSQLLLSAAQNLGVDEASRRMRDALNHRRLGRAVEQAVHQAYEQFAHEIHDRELLTAIERDRPFFQQPEVARLLADAAVATHAAEYAQTVEALAQEMHKVAPGITPSRCERAAEMLVRAIHDEVSSVQELQIGLMLLRGQQLLDEMQRLGPKPDFAPCLREELIATATVIEKELGHGYVVSAHFLYALAIRSAGVAASVLRDKGVTPERVKEALRARVTPYAGEVRDALTAGATKTLDDAQQIARARFADQTRDEHVLEALLNHVIADHAQKSTITAVFETLDLSAHQLMETLIPAAQVESAIHSFVQ